ncbi:Muscle-specific protein 300 kDa [Anthophora retusa]
MQEVCDEEAQADETSDRDDATLDQAPSIHSSLESSSMPSLADVSLQTGQSLLANDVVEKPQQLTKQTSTNQIVPATCHSLTTQTMDPTIENLPTQETIKILKTTEGDHEVIEIATKNLPTTSAQEVVQERPDAIAEDIVVDMRYQDPTNTDNTTSELNIVHATPQSFETVLVEPDDVTTEVVVDEDGSKRIIVRKLRRTTVTSKQTTQQHLSSMSTAIGDAPSVVQAFSEATMRDQQVTMTTTKPNGTIETTTKQIYGGRVATGTPYKDVNVEEYESTPQYTHTITQGHIRDISPQPLEEGILMEGGEYQGKTASVHAVVQQVTRRVVRKTRRIIRKVTIVDGKETATEEIIEEPEEIEIDEKNIPHISINVIKQEEQRQVGPDVKQTEEKAQDRVIVEEITDKECRKDKETATDDTQMQGPFFGAFAKDMHPSTEFLKSEKGELLAASEKDVTIAEEKVPDVDIQAEETPASLEEPVDKDVQKEEPLQSPEVSLIPSELAEESLKQEFIEKKPEQVDKYEQEHFLVEVNDKKSLRSASQAFIDAEVSAGLQSPSEEIKIHETQVEEEEEVTTKSPIESAASEDVASVTKATCKSVDAPVTIETPSIELEGRTVDVEKHQDTISTVVDVLEGKPSIEATTTETPVSTAIIVPAEVEQTVEISGEPPVQVEETKTTSSTPIETRKKEEQDVLPINVKQQIVKDSFIPEIDYSVDGFMDEALKPEYKPIFHKVEISLAVRKEGEEMQPTVSVKSQAEPDTAPYRMVKEDVDIRLPADKESKSVIHDKIVQTSPPMVQPTIVPLYRFSTTSEKEVATSDKSVITSEKEETDKSIFTSEKEETSDNIITSEKEDECRMEPATEPETEKKIEEEIESPMKSLETKSSTSLFSNIAESMEIDVPLSDSSKNISEAPQPDITEILKSRELELSLKDETSEGEDGYEADRTIVSTTTPDDDNVTKTKRRKKRKERIRSSRDEEQTEFPKTTTDEGEFTDDLTPAESEDAKATKKKKKKKKREDVEKGVSMSNEADTQTAPREFQVSVATSPKQEDVAEIYVQTSPQLMEDIDVPKIEEVHEEVQTSFEIPLDVSEKLETPEVQEVHTEMQTSPLPVLDFSTQTVPEEKTDSVKPSIQHTEMQTSPLAALDFGAQTVAEETPRIEEVSTQTLETPTKQMEEYAVQTSPIEEIKPAVVPAKTEETQVQTVATEVISMEAQTSPTVPSIEMETQTAEKIVVAVEQQTTPPPLEEKVLTGIAVQTVTPEVPKTIETEAQTSKPVTPEKITLDFNIQADLIEQPAVEVVETQTTPEESPRQAVTQETESQTISPEPTRETMIQTSPVTISSKVEVCDLSAQTSLEEVKQSMDEQSQTITPDKVKMLDSSIQIKTSELLPQVEESVQSIPETREDSMQTCDEAEKPSLVTTSQQTNGVAKIVDEKESVVIKDEEDNVIDTTIDVVDSSMDVETPPKLTEIPVAPDVQVQETKDYSGTMKDEEAEVASAPEESAKAEERLQKTSEPVQMKLEPEESVAPPIEEKEVEILEIHEQPIVELSSSTTDTAGKSTDISEDTTITEDLSSTAGKVDESNVGKKQKRKRRHKTIEVSGTGEKELESIFGQPVESRDVSLKLSYSDVTKRNVGKEKSPPGDAAPLEKVSEQAEIIDDTEENVQTSPFVATTEPIAVTETQDVWSLSKEGIDSPMELETQHMPSPEPMDTTEEPLSPLETAAEEEERPKIKTYADIISESSKKDQASWEHHTVPQKGASSKAFLLAESREYEPQHQIIQNTQTTRALSDRMESLRNAKEPSHLGNILHIAHLDKMANDEKLDEVCAADVRKELSNLRKAVEENDAIAVEETLVVIVETISTWLETIEYRIFLSKERPASPLHDYRTCSVLKDEVVNVEENIQELNNIWKSIETNYPEGDRNNLQECLDALMNHAKMIEETTYDGAKYLIDEILRWDQFVYRVNFMYSLIEKQREKLNDIVKVEASTKWKLQELDELENANRSRMWETTTLLTTSHELLRDYPGKHIPEETYAAHEITKIIEHEICIERERLLQLLALAEEYEQTLREFAQITEIAENLLESPISVMSLEHLQEEMQKHRKFFVNLNHCRAILESLEGNLDPETRTQYSDLHEKLHSRATSLLDQAASRAQQMALAASRWILLEQGVKEERGWLQVAHQRVPDLQTVTSSDYDQYISLYQTLVTDVATHHARIIQLLKVARSLPNLVNIEDPEDRYGEALDVIVKLQENVESSLRRLMAFKESWCNHETLMNRLENWMSTVEKELSKINDPSGGHIRQFWELKAQYEVHNNIREEATNNFEQALRIIPLSDEMLQRQFHREVQDRWNDVTQQIRNIQEQVTRNISSEEISSNEKLKLLERELNELRMTIDGFHGVLKTGEELDLYIERLTVLFDRISLIQDELGRLGLLPVAESEKVGVLLSSARRIENQIGKELDAAQLLRESLQAIQRGLSRVRKAHQRQSSILDQCEGSEKQGSDVVAEAVDRCQTVADELAMLWQDIMGLRQMLHTLPTVMRVSVSPVSVERDISNLQDTHTDLEARCTRLLALLTNRLTLWKRFERQLEMVQQSVQEADYMMELLTVQGSVDYDRLLKATERLEGLSGDLGAREVLIGELREAAEPLREGCAAEVREKVEAAVNEAVQAWEDTRAELDALCTKYQHACRLWEQYKDSSAAVKAWVDTQMDNVANLPPEEAVKHIKICEETMAEHKERLAELRGLVAQIASDVGLDASGPLHCEVEALGQRLEDIRETLSCLADAADARVVNQELARGDLCQTKNFLDSVQQSITAVSQGESKEQLKLLRNHLLALTCTEPQLQSIKERSLEVSAQEPSLVEVLQLWQKVFKETFQQYHRLSTCLVKTQDGATALKLWQEYLSHVQDFLSNDVPSNYNGLSEHRNLCEVHKNLLTDQQNLILTVRAEEGSHLSTTEQFNILTNLHNETLAKIMERHAAVQNRLAAWDRYKTDQSNFLSWLKEVEMKRGQLHLRFIHLRRLDKILERIQALLDELPRGEMELEFLQEQQETLLVNCDEALAVSIRMEHAADAQRIANMRASLETWRDFIQRIQKLYAEYDEQTKGISSTFDEISEALSKSFHARPASLSRTKEQLEAVQQLQNRLTSMNPDLESLGVITEQLRECLSPSDMKSLNQQRALLYQQHGDLEHQAALLMCRLDERCGLYDRWRDRLGRLITWIEETECRIQDCDNMTPNDPEQALKRLECELQADIALKQRELMWIQNTGQDLIEVAEEEESERLQESLNEVNERWDRLLATGKARASKLIDLMRTMSTLEKRINELRTWLANVESQLSETFVIETLTQECLDKKLEDHEHLQKTIEAESGNVGEVLNLCEILLSDCDAWKASFNTDTIRNGMEGLERRWTTTCVKSAERKGKIVLAWKILQELEQIRTEHEDWLIETDRSLAELENSLDEISKDETKSVIEKARSILNEIDARDSVNKIIEQNFARLARTGLEPDNLKSLISQTRLLIDKWQTLKPRANAVLLALQQGQKNYRDFITVHGAAVVGLTQVDVRLTRTQHLATPEQKASVRRRLQQLREIEEELSVQNVTLQKADELALKVMQECHPDDVATIQELVDEYQLLWKDIKKRVACLRAEIEGQERLEVDEAVQVETLRFEQDSAVQVDTLPRLLRMTSSDAFLMELEAALIECNDALDTLEIAVTPDPVAGPGLNATAKHMSKLIGSCQSSIELVRYLHGLLMEDGKLSPQAAKVNDVTALTNRYENLLLLARTREQQIRELSDNGRLTCPLCSRRNWAQLESDIWRLEKWLEFAEGTQSEQHSPPDGIEELEDIIQDHKQFLIDLDSHKSILASLNTVGAHLSDHNEDLCRAAQLRDRLTIANTRWDKVCTLAAHWQEQLQVALMSNQQFHRIIDELLIWLEKTEISIRANEPVDLTESLEIMTAKYNKFRELRSDLERCEPRVLSLQRSANQLLDEKGETRERLQELRLKLQSLRRLTGIYALKLGSALGMDPRDVGLAATTTSLASLSHDLLDEAASGTDQPHDAPDTDGDDGEPTVLSRGYRFLGRVLRISLPIQALMLLVLGVASLVPSAEEDYSCMLSNNLARSFTPMVVYPNGPPPI